MDTPDNIIFSINWYPNEYPDANDIVAVKCYRNDELRNWCRLLEYGSKDALYSKRPKIHCNANIMYMKVSGVHNNSIDLARSVQPEQSKNAKDRFKKYKKIMYSLLSISRNIKTVQFSELVKKIVHPLHCEYGNAYLALKKSINQQEIINSLDISDDVKNALIDQVGILFMTKVRIHALFEAEIYDSRGVELLRNALADGYEVEKDLDQNLNDKFTLSITVVAPPIYFIHVDILDADKGVEIVNMVLKRIENKILEFKGRFSINQNPNVVENDSQEEINI